MRRSSSGVSLLLECVFGLGLFALALLVIFGLFSQVTRTSSQARQYTLALQTARDYLQRETGKAYSDVNDFGPEAVQVQFESNGAATTLDLQVTVSVVPVPAKRYKDVRCRVDWVDGRWPRHVELETYVVED